MPDKRNQQVTIGQNHQSAKAFPESSRVLRQWLHLQRVILDPAMTRADIAVAQCLLDYDTPDRGAFPSFDTLARQTSLSRRTVAYSVERLVSVGYFSKVAGGGRRRSNTYRPIFQTVQQDAPIAASQGLTEYSVRAPETVQSHDKKQCNPTTRNSATDCTRILLKNPPRESLGGESIDLRGSSEAKARNAAWAVKGGHRLTSVSQLDVRAAVELGYLTAEEAARW